MKIILTTCKNRRQHLAPALASWRQFLPDWTPLLVAVDDPGAVSMLAQTYLGAEWLATEISHPAFSKLQAQAAGVAALPEGNHQVAMLDCDVVALLGMTDHCLSEPLAGGFLIADHRDDGSDFCDDMGQLVAPAEVLREAFELLGDVSHWWGYGWEDVLVRCACWLVTEGKVRRRPAHWAHIPHSNRERVAAFDADENPTSQTGRNRHLILADLERICEPYGITDWRKSGLADLFWRGRKGVAFLP
jgi:hypothetical protein